MPRSKGRHSSAPVQADRTLIRVATDMSLAVKRLPVEQREKYEAAQKSVVEARRRAETPEALIRVI